MIKTCLEIKTMLLVLYTFAIRFFSTRVFESYLVLPGEILVVLLCSHVTQETDSQLLQLKLISWCQPHKTLISKLNVIHEVKYTHQCLLFHTFKKFFLYSLHESKSPTLFFVRIKVQVKFKLYSRNHKE